MHTTLTIHLSAIVANYRLLQAQLGAAECGAVVKADAYGLGVGPVASALAAAGCGKFFVASLEEGITLRQTLFHEKIYIFHGLEAGTEACFSRYNLTPVLNTLAQIKQLRDHAANTGLIQPALLHIDTGMNRLGLSRREAEELAKNQDLLEGISLEYVISHLACADEPEHHKNARQLVAFEEMPPFLQLVPRSLCNSSGIFLGPKYHFELARPGAALYGITPSPLLPNPMQGVITLTSRILQVRDVDFPQTVGYGATYEAPAGSRIAVLPLGYADGYFRSLGNQGSCFMAGHILPVIGRISMDMITVDVTAVPEDKLYPGAEIEIIGTHRTVDMLAAQAGTIGYEVLTSLGKRYKRVYSA